IRARIMTGGYSLYQALQVKFQGRGRTDIRGLKNVNYQFSYAFGQSLATCATERAEFINNTCDNHAVNNNDYFGYNTFSRKHLFSGGAIFDTFGGMRLSTIIGISTRPPLTLNVPALGGISGANALFTTDLNGDGGTGSTPRGDLLPGVKIGDWGVGV